MAISRTSIADSIEEFIRKEYQVPARDRTFTRDAHLFDSGFVDSIGVTQLIAFIESAFDVTIDEKYLFTEDFTTINGITAVTHSCLRDRGSDPFDPET